VGGLECQGEEISALVVVQIAGGNADDAGKRRGEGGRADVDKTRSVVSQEPQ
jgi:hypothetical protein